MTKVVQFNDSAVYVECISPSARFVINETVFALIEDLHFIGCRGNKVNRVEQLVLVNTTFQGVNGSESMVTSVLELNRVAFATIVRSLFSSNSHAVTY